MHQRLDRCNRLRCVSSSYDGRIRTDAIGAVAETRGTGERGSDSSRALGRAASGVRCDRRGDSRVRSADRARGLTARKRSEEHTSELQALIRTSYAVFCSKKKNKTTPNI